MPSRKSTTKPRRPGDPQFERKTAQLCRQVERRLSLSFAELDDPELASLELISVDATPDGSRLLLSLGTSPGTHADEPELLARLRKIRGLLREEVAAAIHRRRTPELDFRVLTPLPPELAPTPPEPSDDQG